MHTTCWIITFWSLWTSGSCQCTADVTRLDFENSTNPLAGFEWMDAFGVVHTAADNAVPAGVSDTLGGAFPGGSMRFTNVGGAMGVGFDLLVTALPDSPHLSASNEAGLRFDVAYVTPPAPVGQGLLNTDGGYACFGTLPGPMRTSFYAYLLRVCFQAHSLSGPTLVGCLTLIRWPYTSLSCRDSRSPINVRYGHA
jgi:hypothetical protein